MCIAAAVNGSTVTCTFSILPPSHFTSQSFISLSPTDVLQSTGVANLGWMAMWVHCLHPSLSNCHIYYPLVDLLLNSLPPPSHNWHIFSFGSGFGSQMVNTPMVILWPNSDGSVTLSQRSASGRFMPTVVSSPPRVASIQNSLVDVSILIIILLVTFLFYWSSQTTTTSWQQLNQD